MDYDKRLLELKKQEQREIERQKEENQKKITAIKLKYERRRSEIKRKIIMFEDFEYKK
jgi:hypothetical protein